VFYFTRNYSLKHMSAITINTVCFITIVEKRYKRQPEPTIIRCQSTLYNRKDRINATQVIKQATTEYNNTPHKIDKNLALGCYWTSGLSQCR